ncbi:hypothetical protein LXA43DRAFT_905491, partial [Ganoderma leucocontextum]
MRTLGSWVGNGISTHPQWESILKRQERTVEIWKKARLSNNGKQLIAKSLIQSISLYLATVNGMPKDVEKRMEKILRDFLWDGKKIGYMRYDEVIMPKEDGGLNMPDIRARNEAIQVMWLQRYLKEDSKRPVWAFVLDKILFDNLPPKPIVEMKARSSWIIQKWHEYASKKDTLPHYAREMFRIGRKYNIGIDAIKVSTLTKRAMTIWYHPAIKNNHYWNKKSSKCLRDHHSITTL